MEDLKLGLIQALTKEKTVLVIEDDHMSRTMIARILSHLFHRVLEAENGLKGLEFYQSEKPDIIITDITMPGMDGTRLIQEIRNEDPHLKILVMSAYTQEELPASLRDMNIAGTVSKPINRKILFDALEKALG